MSSENQPPPPAKFGATPESTPPSASGPAPESAPPAAPPSPGPPPARETPVRRAWTRAARAQSLRRYLGAALIVAALAGAVAAWFERASPPSPGPAPSPAPAASAPPAPLASTGAPVLTPPPSDELRLSQTGAASLILAPQPALAPETPTIEMSPPPPSPAGAPPSANPAPGLPTVTVEPHAFHPVPSEAETPSIGPITLNDRLGRSVRLQTNVPPPSYVPSVGPPASSPGVSSNPRSPPAKTAALPPLPPQRSAGPLAPLVANPPVFSGRALALGGVGIEVAGLKVRLFGVRPPEDQDRCAGANGKPVSCASAVLAAMQQRLAGHSIVACRVPSGQSGEPGAICLDEEGTDLGRYLVIQGYALADVGQSYDYLPAEGAARTAKRGLWRYR